MGNYLEEMNKEIERRIEIIESPEYEYVPEVPRNDIIIATIISAACFFILAIAYNFLT